MRKKLSPNPQQTLPSGSAANGGKREYMSGDYQLNLPRQTLETVDGRAKPVLGKGLAQVGFIPNMHAAERQRADLPGIEPILRATNGSNPSDWRRATMHAICGP